jgi:hypothetical protein
MGYTGNPVFLSEASRLLKAGRPGPAQEKLSIFSSDSREAVLPQEYFRMRAIIALLNGETEEAADFITEIGGVTLEFFTNYEAAYIACLMRPRKRWLHRTKRSQKKYEKFIKDNLRQLVAMSENLPVASHQRYGAWLGITA